MCAGAAGFLSRPLARLPDLLALQQADPRRYPCLLESAATGPRGRYDLLLASEGEGFALDARGRLARLDGAPMEGGFLDALAREFSAAGRERDAGPPFVGGWALFLGYELAAQIEPRLRLPPPPEDLPIALALRCRAAIIVDRVDGTARVVAETGAATLLEAVHAEAAQPRAPVSAQIPAADVREDAPARFVDGVERVLDYLAAGDVFQVNLSRAWQAKFAAAPDPAALYARLREANPAPFGGLLRGDGWSLLSSSPERLVSRRGARIETRPIAGTRPRLPGEDVATRARELVGNPKERAEHIMLIDLERNDLGRVCAPGSVRVEALMEVESYAHVHHIESTVAGVALPGIGPADLIRAVFPGGTITGCPKVRCMEIIAELEGCGRGPYTGALGWLDIGGDLDLNILIRSAWLRGDRLGLRAGAGIVADSQPERELHETRAKARGLLRALGDG